jgi:excisionase family DNA binding protein
VVYGRSRRFLEETEMQKSGSETTEARVVLPDKLVSKDAAAEVLGVPKRWVERAIAERRLESVKVGKYVMIKPASLLAFIEENTVPASGVRRK